MDINDPDLIEICNYIGKTDDYMFLIQEVSRKMNLEYDRVMSALNILESKHLGVVTRLTDEKFFQYVGPFWEFYSSDYQKKCVQFPALKHLPNIILEEDHPNLIQFIAKKVISLQSLTDIHELLSRQVEELDLERGTLHEEFRQLVDRAEADRGKAGSEYNYAIQIKHSASELDHTRTMKDFYERLSKKIKDLT